MTDMLFAVQLEQDTLLTSEKSGTMAELDLFGPQPSKTIPIGNFALTLMKEDDTFGELEFMAWFLLRVLRTDEVGPIEVRAVQRARDRALI